MVRPPMLEVPVIDDFDFARPVVHLRDGGDRRGGQRLEGVWGTFQCRHQVDGRAESLDGQRPVPVVAELQYPGEQLPPFLIKPRISGETVKTSRWVRKSGDPSGVLATLSTAAGGRCCSPTNATATSVTVGIALAVVHNSGFRCPRTAGNAGGGPGRTARVLGTCSNAAARSTDRRNRRAVTSRTPKAAIVHNRCSARISQTLRTHITCVHGRREAEGQPQVSSDEQTAGDQRLGDQPRQTGTRKTHDREQQPRQRERQNALRDLYRKQKAQPALRASRTDSRRDHQVRNRGQGEKLQRVVGVPIAVPEDAEQVGARAEVRAPRAPAACWCGSERGGLAGKTGLSAAHSATSEVPMLMLIRWMEYAIDPCHGVVRVLLGPSTAMTRIGIRSIEPIEKIAPK